MNTSAPYGLRVLGRASGRREVVPFERAARLYANADPTILPDIPAFLSAFRYPDELRTLVNNTGGTAGYSGPIGIDAINFDIDRTDLCEAVNDSRRLVAFLADRWSLSDRNLVVAFSGSKGFHVSIPVTGIEPTPDNHHIARRLASSVANLVGIAIDESVYLPTQLWRAMNSRHPRSGLYKIRLDANDLLYITADAIRQRAIEPIPFDPPERLMHSQLLAEWAQTARAFRQEVEERVAARSHAVSNGTDGAKINALTRSFLSDGAAPGERHRLVFSCAANLAEFSNVDDLIAALITRPALQTGLTDREVARQIACGIEYTRKKQKGILDA